MGILFENLGINGFLGALFGQTGSFSQTINVGKDDTFSSSGGFERYGTATGGLVSHPTDNWDSYDVTNGTLISGDTAGGGTATWDMQYGSFEINNSEVIPGLGLLESDTFTYTLDTSAGSAWDLLPVGSSITETITVSAFEGGGRFFPDLDGDIGNTSDTFTFTFTFVKLPCIVRGARIRTDKGDVPIETLKVGDLVETMDNGLQPIRWIGSKTVSADGDFAPVLFKKGALGNSEDFSVSPQHRMLISGWDCELMFSEKEVLVAAKDLVDGQAIQRVESDEVEYFHILFDQHEVIFANGCATESLHLSENSVPAFGEKARQEILAIFPDLSSLDHADVKPSRIIIKGYEAATLMTSGIAAE